MHLNCECEYKDNFYTIFILEMKLVISYYWYSPTYMTQGFLRIRSPPGYSHTHTYTKSSHTATLWVTMHMDLWYTFINLKLLFSIILIMFPIISVKYGQGICIARWWHEIHIKMKLSFFWDRFLAICNGESCHDSYRLQLVLQCVSCMLAWVTVEPRYNHTYTVMWSMNGPLTTHPVL